MSSKGKSEGEKSDYQYLKEQGFNSMKEFASSYGEKSAPQGFHNAKVILGTLREDDPGSAAGKWYKSEKEAGRQPTLEDE